MVEKIITAEISPGVNSQVRSAIAGLEDKINQMLDIQTMDCPVVEIDSRTKVCNKVRLHNIEMICKLIKSKFIFQGERDI